MLLRLNNVSKAFDGVVALSDISLEIREGERLGLIGPNGSGKTTIFNIIGRIFDPDGGTIDLDKENILKLSPSDLIGRGIARVFQSPQLCNRLTVFENVYMGIYHRESGWIRNVLRRNLNSNAGEALRLLRFLNLQGSGDNLPESLSYFDVRKAEVARALISNPRLLLLDEPTSGFTQAERDEFMDILRRINSDGITLFLIEHDLSMIRQLCNRVVVLDAGKKVSEGSPDFVENDKAVEEVYLGMEHAAR